MEIIEIIGLILPWVIAIILAVVVYIKQKKVIDIKEVAEEADRILSEVLAFFDKEKAMADTSLDTIQTVIPATTYQMTEEDCNRILDTCASDEERARIDATIMTYENPVVEGEECCVYTIETTGAIFEVRYGNPVLLLDKTKV